MKEAGMNGMERLSALAGGGGDLRPAANAVQKMGAPMGDTILAHINPQEAALLKALGGAGARNPVTGLPMFFNSADTGYGMSDADQDGVDDSGSNDRESSYYGADYGGYGQSIGGAFDRAGIAEGPIGASSIAEATGYDGADLSRQQAWDVTRGVVNDIQDRPDLFGIPDEFAGRTRGLSGLQVAIDRLTPVDIQRTYNPSTGLTEDLSAVDIGEALGGFLGLGLGFPGIGIALDESLGHAVHDPSVPSTAPQGLSDGFGGDGTKYPKGDGAVDPTQPVAPVESVAPAPKTILSVLKSLFGENMVA